MQIQPHTFHTWHMLLNSALSGTAGAAVMKWVKDKWGPIIEAMPPLPANATWGQTWLYNALHAVAKPGKENS